MEFRVFFTSPLTMIDLRRHINCEKYNLKNVKNTHGVLLFTKINTPPRVFFTFLNCTNSTKSCKTSQFIWSLKSWLEQILFELLLEQWKIVLTCLLKMLGDMLML